MQFLGFSCDAWMDFNQIVDTIIRSNRVKIGDSNWFKIVFNGTSDKKFELT